MSAFRCPCGKKADGLSVVKTAGHVAQIVVKHEDGSREGFDAGTRKGSEALSAAGLSATSGRRRRQRPAEAGRRAGA